MKKFLMSLTVFLAILAISSPASAILIDVAGSPASSVTISNIDKDGLWIADPVATLSSNLDNEIFSLNAGESYTFDFFNVSVGGFIGGGTADFSATLAFDVPLGLSGTGEGDGSWLTLFGVLSAGELTWTQQPVLDGPLSVVFSNIREFGVGNTATVQATVTAAPVPEPGTIVLMGLGLVGLAGMGRKKLFKK